MSTPSPAHPPYEPDNLVAVTHGARSDALVGPEAIQLIPTVLDANPHLDAVRDGHGVYRYAMILARIARVYRWLCEQGDAVFDDVHEGTIHGAYERLERWERAADRAEERLAIAPLTRAKLGLDKLRGFDLASKWAAEDGDQGAGR